MLFENKQSYYIKHLKQYEVFRLKEKNNRNSWSRYNTTIKKYFEYLESNIGYRELKYLNTDDFVSFNKADIDNKRKKIVSSVKTIANRYAHIKNFYDLFEKHGLIIENPFRYNISDDELCKIYDLKNVEEPTPLTIDEINYILQSYENTREPERNRIMFLLCLYCGASRQDLSMLKTSDIDIENGIINFSDKAFNLPREFINEIDNYLHNIRKKVYNSDYFFVKKYKGYSEKPMSVNNINLIINKAQKYLEENTNSRHIQVNLEKLKGMLIKKLFEADYSLEEIIAITGMSLSSLSNYISTESILEKTEIKLSEKKHPYIQLFS